MLSTENAVIIPAATTMASNITSSPIPQKLMNAFGVQIVWSGTPVGTWSLQITEDVGVENPDGSVSGLVNWSTEPGSSQAITTSGDIVYAYWADFPHKWARILYTAGSSTGSITSARFNAKGE